MDTPTNPTPRPTISVAMTTYNGADHLQGQLDSILAQTQPPVELQVGDDGSTDDTLAMLEAFARIAPFSVIVTRNQVNLGYGENFLQTATRCSGDWVAFCDQDDLWDPMKLEVVGDAIAAHGSDLQLVVHQAEVTDAADRKLRDLFDWHEDRFHRSLDLDPDWFVQGVAQVFRRSLLEGLPLHPRITIPGHDFKDTHDVWVSLLANATGSILLLERSLVTYRRHGATVTGYSDHAPPMAASVMRDVGDECRARADHLWTIADVLRTHAGATVDGEKARTLAAAAAAVRREALASLGRAALYGSRSAAAGGAALAKLMAGGGYWTGPRALGARSLVKDAAFLALRTLGRSPEANTAPFHKSTEN